MDSTTHTLPTLYLPHGGGPCFFMDWSPLGPTHTWDKMKEWLLYYAKNLAEKPKAIIIISAHWEENQFTLLTKPKPSLYFDYYGFPKHTYELTYPVVAATELIPQVENLLKLSGIPYATDSNRDFDHGVFIPLKLMFPDADIPILQISLKNNLNPEEHFELGKALAPLRNEGVLLLGSGMSYHQVSEFFADDPHNLNHPSEKFDAWLNHTLTALPAESRNEQLNHWATAPGGRASHPREEHLIPLMVVTGAAGNAKGHTVFTDLIMGKRVSAFEFR